MNQVDERTLLHRKQCSRRLALQAMYQWHFTNEEIPFILNQYQEDDYWPKADHEYFKSLVSGCIDQVTEIDRYIDSSSDYTVDKIDPIELSALRIAIYELINCVDVPEKVIVAEAIRLCKKFGSDEGYKLVNVVLDKLITRFDRKQILHKN